MGYFFSFSGDLSEIITAGLLDDSEVKQVVDHTHLCMFCGPWGVTLTFSPKSVYSCIYGPPHVSTSYVLEYFQYGDFGIEAMMSSMP